MPSKYPVCTPAEIIRVLEKRGFYFVSQKGSHMKYSDGKNVTIIPNHREVSKGTLKCILEQADMTLEEFVSFL